MSKQIKIQIFRDGRIQAETNGIKGKACTNYIRILEQILDAKAVDSEFTPEYYQEERLHAGDNTFLDQDLSQKIKI